MNKPTPQPSEYIAPMTLRLYAGSSTNLTDKALTIFEEQITAYSWALREDGMIVGKKLDEEKYGDSVSFAIDADDPLTVESFNKLPRYFKKRVNLAELARMRMKVLAYPSSDAEFPFWSPEDNSDTIVFDERGVYIEGVKSLWDVTSEVAII